jgi:hypothetical protein
MRVRLELLDDVRLTDLSAENTVLSLDMIPLIQMNFVSKIKNILNLV